MKRKAKSQATHSGLGNPNAAAIDIGATIHVAAVGADLRHYLSTRMSAKAHYSSLIELRASVDRSTNTPPDAGNGRIGFPSPESSSA